MIDEIYGVAFEFIKARYISLETQDIINSNIGYFQDLNTRVFLVDVFLLILMLGFIFTSYKR